MQVTGMLYGSKLLEFAGFPTTEVLGPAASEEEIKAMLDKHGLIFIKPVFKGGIGKKGKAGLLGRAKDLQTALAEKERLYFAEHQVGHVKAKANGVTFEAGVPAKHEVYFSISDSTHFRAPTMTLTHMGGMDIEELDKTQVASVPFGPAHRPEGLRGGQRPHRNRRTQGNHFAVGAAVAQAVGTVSQFRHDHAGAESDPNARGQERTPDTGGLRLQVRLRPRRPALAALEAASAPVRRRLFQLRAGN